jgi:uncharacterized protein involved in high-affinity Fe2+ transport
MTLAFRLMLIAVMAAGATTAAGVAAAQPQPTVKVLPEPADPTQKTILVGRARAGGMIIQFELEPAKAMWMPMGTPAHFMEHPVGVDERYHVEVKPIDPRSKTRISYAEVTFAAANKDNGRKIEGVLHPMWGGSGLHYAMNSALAGDGVYDAVVTVGAPMFGRAPEDKDLWQQPVSARFHFKLAGGKLVEVSEPVPID